MKPKPSNTLLPRKRSNAPKADTPPTPAKRDGEDDDLDEEEEEEEEREEEEEGDPVEDAPAAKLSVLQRAKLRLMPTGKLIEQIAGLQGKLTAAKAQIADLKSLEEEAIALDEENDKLRAQIATGKKEETAKVSKGIVKELSGIGLGPEKLPVKGGPSGTLLDQLNALTSASERVVFMRANKAGLVAEEAALDAAKRSKSN